MSDEREQFIARLAAAQLVGEGHCPICRWPLKESAKDGCVLGNCSFRSDSEAERSQLRTMRKVYEKAVASHNKAWQAGRLAALEEAAQEVQCTPVGEPHTRGGWTREYCEYCQLAAAIRQLKERK